MSSDITKTQETGLAKWDDELAKYAKDAADVEELGGNFISLQAGIISIGGEPVKGNKLDVIVIDAVYENAYYEGKFDPNNKKPPVCFAFSHEKELLAPHKDSPKPQHSQCAGCPLNEFDSAEDERGGKACKNVKRLAVIPLPSKSEEVVGSEVKYLKVPVTSVKNWAKYVKGLQLMVKRPPFAVGTQISTTPDKVSQFKVLFAPLAPLGDEYRAPIMQMREMVMGMIEFPYKAQAEGTETAAPKQLKSDPAK
jgi:hypothetical protein